MDYHVGSMTCTKISYGILRPFVFFITCLAMPHKGIQTREINCMHRCFKILLENVNSSGTSIFLLFFYTHLFIFIWFKKFDYNGKWFLSLPSLLHSFMSKVSNFSIFSFGDSCQKINFSHCVNVVTSYILYCMFIAWEFSQLFVSHQVNWCYLRSNLTWSSQKIIEARFVLSLFSLFSKMKF